MIGMLLNGNMQATELSDKLSSLDLATPDNLKELSDVGSKLLGKPVAGVNPNTGRYEEVDENILNEAALKRYNIKPMKLKYKGYILHKLINFVLPGLQGNYTRRNRRGRIDEVELVVYLTLKPAPKSYQKWDTKYIRLRTICCCWLFQ